MRALSVLAVLIGLGCSSDPDRPATVPSCVPGSAELCAADGGGAGVRVCQGNESASFWGPCVSPEAGTDATAD